MELPKLTKEIAMKIKKQREYENKFIDKPLRVIFLDIDGVMNSDCSIPPFLADMEESKLALLKKVMEENLFYGIVLTSDRRHSKTYINEFEKALEKYEIFMIDTIREPNNDVEDNKGKQIRDYLDIATDIDRFVILDAMDDGISNLFPNEYIQINRCYGLNEETIDRIKKVVSVYQI